MKLDGIILAAGKGTRLRPITFSIPKPLIPIMGRPIVGYGIEQLKKLGIKEITMVVGWLHEVFEEVLGNGERFGIKIKYVLQEKRLGIAHAINLALTEGDINNPFLVYLGDNVLNDSWINNFKNVFKDYDSIIFLARVKDPRRFGVAIIKDDRVVGFIEKPKVPPSDLALVGLYYFKDPEDFRKCYSTLKPSWRGEYEITDIINCYIRRGLNIGYIVIDGWWKDTGKPEDLIDAMMIIMDNYLDRSQIKGEVNGEVYGRVIVEEGAIVNGKVYGPAYIGKGVYVSENTVIEHYVDLEKDVKIDGGHVTRSLVLDSSTFKLGRSRLIDSIIGPYSDISVSHDLRLKLKLTASQESKIFID
ncbi:glucose-1-phosphate thymidylyltransferase [Ignicoccus islandicus DSM 13165]|uniref:Glucose-1-phosphate thymidylyltransferase n=1 Tax=Ignicoccus islandicus DSM 13165 TaxID=940295 RepID=A0A0U3FQB0_9CREN|nr:glucose-1-phosphate thymidylyltransferase [Ignicoccus islandicus]ALU11648.1 glucose-1-phosphate thymidylyltransferase [Ignicoccus islandicus DSM 13165]